MKATLVGKNLDTHDAFGRRRKGRVVAHTDPPKPMRKFNPYAAGRALERLFPNIGVGRKRARPS